MTDEDLHRILDDSSKKITIPQFQEVIQALKNDVFHLMNDMGKPENEREWYSGEHNAFQIVLDLSEHIKE